MKQYELLYIVSTKYTDAEVETVNDKIGALLTKFEAKILRQENIGKIRLAFPIKGQRNGTYMLVHFDAEPNVSIDLDRQLRLTDEVLRHLIVERTPGAETRHFALEAYQSPLTDEGHRRRDEKHVAPTRTAAVTKADEPSMSIEELDKKLDEILEDKTIESV